MALWRGKREFSSYELVAFKVSELSFSSYIDSELAGKIFKPVATGGTEIKNPVLTNDVQQKVAALGLNWEEVGSQMMEFKVQRGHLQRGVNQIHGRTPPRNEFF